MQNNNRTVKKILQKPKQSKKYVFLAKCIENVVLREKYCQQNRGKWARETKLDTFKQNEMVCFKNRLRWSKKKKNKNSDNHMQIMTATLVRH